MGAENQETVDRFTWNSVSRFEVLLFSTSYLLLVTQEVIRCINPRYRSAQVDEFIISVLEYTVDTSIAYWRALPSFRYYVHFGNWTVLQIMSGDLG